MRICLQADLSDQTLAFAGEELVRFLGLLPLPPGDYSVSMLVEEAAGPEDSYRYCFSPSGGVVAGSSSRSVLLGVYDYLRKLGFVFLHPGAGGTFVPQRDSILWGEVCHKADFAHRGVCIEGADSLENVLDFIDWMPKVGFNAFFVQFQKPDIFFERWYNHVFNPIRTPEPKSRQALDGMDGEIARAMALRGIEVHRVGHGWTAEALGFPGTGWRTESRPLDADTLEITAQVGGKRGLWGGIPANTNLCYASMEARKRLAERVILYAREHPQVDYLHFWLADGYNNICECEDCRKTTLSDQYVSLLNEIDRRLTEENLNTKLVFLLYQELLYAPKKERIQNPDRFCLMFAPISRTFEKSYPRDGGSGAVTPYVRNHMRLPETVEENLAHYRSWKTIFPGDSFFFDYPLGRAHYGDFGYMKIARVIYDDIHALKALGTNGCMSCQELRAMMPTGFPDFVMGQSLLDESLSYENLKETYFSAMFGEDYPAVVSHLERLSTLSDTDYFNGHGPRYRPELESRFREIGERAEAFLGKIDGFRWDMPSHRAHWLRLKFHCRYCILLSAALRKLCTADPGADEAFEAFCGFIRQEEPRHQPLLDVYRVIEVATGYTGFSRGSRR